MGRWWILGCASVVALSMVACEDGDGGGGGQDAAPPDAGEETVLGVLAHAEGGAVGPADYACRGTRTAPTGGDEVSFTGSVEDFFTEMAVEGLTVQYFPDNLPSVDGSCMGSCVELTSNASGDVSLSGPEGGWIAYRVQAGDGVQAGASREYIEAVQSNVVVPAEGGSENLIAVSASTRATIISLLGVSPQDGTATITGQVTDCAEGAVQHARVRVFDSSGEVEFGSDRSGPRTFYFAGGTPNARQRATNTDGIFGATNVPIPAGEPVRVEIWGSMADDEPEELLGCEETVVIADGITIINIGPLRSDAPEGCGS